MEVYHASTVVVETPDTAHSRAFLDFGPGFYECLHRLIFEEPNNQICIRSQQVLNGCLTFKSSQRL